MSVNWDKINSDFERVINTITDEELIAWSKNRLHNKRINELNFDMRASMQAMKLQFRKNIAKSKAYSVDNKFEGYSSVTLHYSAIKNDNQQNEQTINDYLAA